MSGLEMYKVRTASPLHLLSSRGGLSFFNGASIDISSLSHGVESHNARLHPPVHAKLCGSSNQGPWGHRRRDSLPDLCYHRCCTSVVYEILYDPFAGVGWRYHRNFNCLGFVNESQVCSVLALGFGIIRLGLAFHRMYPHLRIAKNAVN